MARRRKPSLARRLMVLVLLAAAIAAGGTWFVWRGPGPLAARTTVEVPEGATMAGTARALQSAGAIRSVALFRRLARLFGSADPIRAGEYALPAHVSAATLLDILQHGRALQHLVTIPEGMPAVLVQRKLAAEPLLTGAATLPAEGSVLPQTYGFQAGETRAAVIARMQAAMRRALDEAWAARGARAAVGSKRDALILASIVEKETGVPAERPMVAAVFSNRLRAGMPLQADPTVIYPITHGLPLGRRILASELRAKNGYNTYAETGLPQAPIANPGIAAIRAVINPAPSKALYFVADGSGGHAFADTLAEHEANVKKWYALRRQRGEM